MKRKPITVAFRAFCLSLLFVMSAFAAAQAAKPMKLTGRVVDPDGFSLVGVRGWRSPIWCFLWCWGWSAAMGAGWWHGCADKK